MIWIRADANPEIGSGHIMRCLSIADACRALGERVCFILADDGAAALLEGRGQEYLVLGTAYNHMEEELEPGRGEGGLQGLLQTQKPDLLLVDSYFVTERYFALLRKYVKVIYMDDIPRFDYAVDGIVNYNIYGENMEYNSPSISKRWLGPAYAPLRTQFQRVEYEVRHAAEDVLITTGGSDKYNLAGLLLDKVLSEKQTGKLRYHVVSGALNPHFAILEALAEKHDNIRLYRNVTDMAELMKRCDIAITAGGSTMYELSAVGVPLLCFSFVDNQERIVEAFWQRGLAAYGGNYLKEQECFAANVAKALAELAADEERRRQYSRRLRAVVDGEGAGRLALALLGREC